MPSSTGSAQPRAVTGARRAGVALRHRNFQLFFAGQLISLIGTWMQSLAQGWLVLQLTHDPFVLGVISAVQFLPVMLFGLFGGLIADALPKRTIIIATQTASMLLALALFWLTWTHQVQAWQVGVLALLLGVVNTVDNPTRQAFVVEMVGRDDVVNAVALNSAVFNTARIVGPALAGIIIGVVGIASCFFLNGISYIAVIIGLFAMRTSELHGRSRYQLQHRTGAVVADLAEGLRYVRATPVVLLAVAVVGLVSTLGMNLNVLVPVYSADVLRAGATGFGFLMAATGLGALVAAVAIAFVGRSSPRVMLLGAGLLGALQAVLLVVHAMPVALACLFGVGFGSIAMSATANTSIQLAVPDDLRGRVMSVYTTVFAGSTPIGALFAGTLASQFGSPVSFAAGGVSSLAVAVGAFVLARPWLARRAAGAGAVDPGSGPA
jgi:MFS family permease